VAIKKGTLLSDFPSNIPSIHDQQQFIANHIHCNPKKSQRRKLIPEEATQVFAVLTPLQMSLPIILETHGQEHRGNGAEGKTGKHPTEQIYK
jgi:hypothetical protein